MSDLIHPLACVHPDAKIGKNTRVDAFAVIDEKVVIGENCHIHSHAKIAKYTTMGDNCRVYLGASVGEDPQDHRYNADTVSYTKIGNYVCIREYATVHRPPFEEKSTVIGDHTLLMAFVHLGHDCQIADHVTIANLTTLAGHVEIDSGVVISASALFHQFVRVGKLAMIGPNVAIRQDIPPYCMVNDDGHVLGMNAIGLRRAGISSASRIAINRAIRTYFAEGLIGSVALAKIEETDGQIPEVRYFIDFIRASKRGIIAGAKNIAFDE